MKYNELVAEMTAAHTTADVMAVIDKFVKSPERKSANKVATMKAFGGDSVDRPVNAEYGKVAPGREVNPLRIDEKALCTVHQAATVGQNVRVKAFSSPVSLSRARRKFPQVQDSCLTPLSSAESL